MSRYQVDKLLRDIRRDNQLAARFREDADRVLDSYRLEPDEREMLKRWEIRKLYDRGVNPLLLLLAHGSAGRQMHDYGPAMNSTNRGEGD